MAIKPGIFVRAGEPFNYDVRAASDESGLSCPEKGRTIQSAKDEVDINNIAKRFGLTGQLPSGVRVPVYQDFDDIIDYHSAMIQVRLANEAFLQMPANVRARFNNDAGAFVDFVNDDANRAEAEKLGIVVPKDKPPVAATSGASEGADAPVSGGSVPPVAKP